MPRSYIRPRAKPAALIWAIAAGNGARTTTNSGARRLSAASSFSEDRCVGPNSARHKENTGDHEGKVFPEWVKLNRRPAEKSHRPCGGISSTAPHRLKRGERPWTKQLSLLLR
jgi:hypothetical protein